MLRLRLAGVRPWRHACQPHAAHQPLHALAVDQVARRARKTRARVEHVFAGLAQLGGKALRSIGLPRATLQLNWKVAAYHLQRLVYLKEARIEAF